MRDAQALTIRAPSREAAEELAGRLPFTHVQLVDGEVQGCRVLVPVLSADVFNRTLSKVSGWLGDARIASIEVEYDGLRYVVDSRTSSRLGIDAAE